ncbi:MULTISPECIES: DUF948 domain-containing protein [Catellatospora]|jgi:uncharacterized protein YoxC|uniref:DUF948 domain-containing protein n=3 Tax=Catellatospora TaxID=53365 RepID=A0A8J3KR52_9ACTN|nr:MULTISPECIES: DUF948 domain-containing protein [Catellatospora]RKE11768.1 uncharacterized protein DUF948 [Catellatospora citrea]GIF99819.1 hypothetical protein Cci01nite_49130 [Catellatospora citrea]GIG04681.1 hypothetical protein Cco03nite_13810 [Catellatospora coxensis]
MSGGEIAALIAAGAFAMLVLVLAVPILRLRHTVDAATVTLRQVSQRTGPILDNVNLTVDNVNTALGQTQVTLDGVNVQLAKVDVMTQHLAATTANVSNLVSVVTATAASPLVKAAAFTYGVRRATAARKEADEAKSVRDELKARKRTRRG